MNMEKKPLDSAGGLESSTNSGDSSEGSTKGSRKEKVQFSGPCSFVVSLLGYSMGTSDFWRFPYVVFRNGGGAFLIPFALTMLVCGTPLFFLEVSMSQFSGKGSLGLWNLAPFLKLFPTPRRCVAFNTHSPRTKVKVTARGIGFSILVLNLINNVYYNVLRAWILEYLVSTFSHEVPWQSCNHTWSRPGCIELGQHIAAPEVVASGSDATAGNATTVYNMTAAEQFWQYRILDLSSGLEDLGGIHWNYVFYVFLWRLLVAICMVRSIKSIEKVMFVTVFIPILLMMILLIRTLLLDGSVMGILYYITPTFSRITDVKVWLEAALMACYTLGPGWGTLPMIGSHNKFNSNCLRHSVITTVCDCLSAIINGLVCFSILGVMARDSGLELEKTVTSGLSLGFTVYPTAFTYFPLPQLWSAIFFVNLILVGLDAQILSAETVMNCLEDLMPRWFKGKNRLLMVALVNFLAFAFTIPFCTKGGAYIFQLLDWYAVAWSILFMSFVECITFMWIYGGDRISHDLTIMLGRPLPVILRVCAAFVTPAILLTLLIISFVQYRPPSYGTYQFPAYAQVLGWAIAIIVVLPILLVFVWSCVRSSGTCKQKFSAMLKPSRKWKPNDQVLQESYNDISESNRSFTSVLIYNITGQSAASRRPRYHVANSHDQKDVNISTGL